MDVYHLHETLTPYCGFEPSLEIGNCRYCSHISPVHWASYQHPTWHSSSTSHSQWHHTPPAHSRGCTHSHQTLRILRLLCLMSLNWFGSPVGGTCNHSDCRRTLGSILPKVRSLGFSCVQYSMHCTFVNVQYTLYVLTQLHCIVHVHQTHAILLTMKSFKSASFCIMSCPIHILRASYLSPLTEKVRRIKDILGMGNTTYMYHTLVQRRWGHTSPVQLTPPLHPGTATVSYMYIVPHYKG